MARGPGDHEAGVEFARRPLPPRAGDGGLVPAAGDYSGGAEVPRTKMMRPTIAMTTRATAVA